MRKKNLFAVAAALGCAFVTGCSNADRSLCLFTDTTVGFELTFDSKSATPAKTILGYNRSEGLMNPVYSEGTSVTYDNNGTIVRSKTITPNYRNEAYSVIVKMNGHKQAQAKPDKAKSNSGQLFITGQAANLLAQNPIAVAALTDDRDVAIEAVRTAERVEVVRSAYAANPAPEVRTAAR